MAHGKTTLLNCISTIDRVTAGKIIINGIDITKLKGNQLNKFRREQLGFIFQDFNLLDTLTAYENIALALTIAKTDAHEIDKRVKYIKHEKNRGLFQARITGASIATGEYIAFLDSDDYVSIDYYRTLMQNIEENNADIAMGNMVLEYDDGRKEIYNLFDAKHLNLAGEDCLDEYFEQEGLSFDWHIIWNKIYKMEI